MTSKIRCIVVEDEPLASDILVDYIAQVNHLQLVRVCSDALFALELLQNEKIDLIFLDIHLPKLKGLDFLKSLNHPPQVILTTAYDQYAVEAFGLNVVDYLLKPIEFSRFVKAVNKLKLTDNKYTQTIDDQSNTKSVFLKSGGTKVKIDLDQILYVESKKENLQIVTSQQTIQIRGQMNDVQEMLNGVNLLRIHRSYYVAPSHINSYNSSHVSINSIDISIGRSYRQSVSDHLQQLFERN